MSWIMYLAIAMVCMQADALCCYVSGTRYRVVGSSFASLMWPITCPIVIMGVIREQRTDEDDDQ